MPHTATHAAKNALSPPHEPALTAPLRGLLEQIDAFVAALPDGLYDAAPPAHLAGSIGGHVRHCLDHVAALTACPDQPTLDYDHRERGTAIERDPAAARDAVRRLSQQLEPLDAMDAETPLHATLALTPQHPTRDYATTLGREVAFVLSHTVHHQALLAAAAKAAGLTVPDGFGVAPATLAHRAS